jgi:hypothetical protein
MLQEGSEEIMSWQRIRLQALERDGFICQECHERKEFMEVHHKIPRKMGGPDTLDNLISLCRKCHFDLHGKDNNMMILSQVQQADPEIQPMQRIQDQEQYDPPTNPYGHKYYGAPYDYHYPGLATGNSHLRCGLPFATDPLRRKLPPRPTLPKAIPSLGPARTLSKHKYGAQAI